MSLRCIIKKKMYDRVSNVFILRAVCSISYLNSVSNVFCTSRNFESFSIYVYITEIFSRDI